MNKEKIQHLTAQAVAAAWRASYLMGESWEERLNTVEAARVSPQRALVCYTAIIRSFPPCSQYTSYK